MRTHDLTSLSPVLRPTRAIPYDLRTEGLAIYAIITNAGSLFNALGTSVSTLFILSD